MGEKGEKCMCDRVGLAATGLDFGDGSWTRIVTLRTSNRAGGGGGFSLTCNGVQRRGRVFGDVGVVFRVDREWTPMDEVELNGREWAGVKCNAEKQFAVICTDLR